MKFFSIFATVEVALTFFFACSNINDLKDGKIIATFERKNYTQEELNKEAEKLSEDEITMLFSERLNFEEIAFENSVLSRAAKSIVDDSWIVY